MNSDGTRDSGRIWLRIKKLKKFEKVVDKKIS